MPCSSDYVHFIDHSILNWEKEQCSEASEIPLQKSPWKRLKGLELFEAQNKLNHQNSRWHIDKVSWWLNFFFLMLYKIFASFAHHYLITLALHTLYYNKGPVEETKTNLKLTLLDRKIQFIHKIPVTGTRSRI